MSIDVRGIYVTALSKLLLDSGFYLSNTSRAIVERLKHLRRMLMFRFRMEKIDTALRV